MPTDPPPDVSPRLAVGAGLPLRLRDRWRHYEIYLCALLIFIASRVVVIVGVNVGKKLVRAPDPAKLDIGSAWYYRLVRWDSAWYHDIVHNGYYYGGDPSVSSPPVFFPLYPLVSYALKSLTGIDEYVALLLVANIAALVAVLLLTKFVREELGDEVAILSVALFCFFPSSLFLSAGYAESLCLVLVVLSFILLAREQFVPAAIMAGLAAATRPTGLVLVPVILWEMWRRNTLPWPRLLPRMALCGILAASGLLAYMAYLGVAFGDPLAFATGQAAWHSGSLSDRFLAAITLIPFRHAYPEWIGMFVCFLVVSVWSFWRLRAALSIYALGTLLLPYLTLGITGSMSRFVLMCFPASMCVALFCRRRLPVTLILIGLFAAGLLWEAALFSQWYFVG